MRTRLLAGAIGLLLLLSTGALVVVRDRTAPVTAAAPRPGTYRYHATSTSTTGTAPSTTTDRVTRDFTLHYEPVSQSADETRLRRSGEQSGSQDKAWRADGIYDVTETYVGQSGTHECQWQPPKLVIRLPLRSGSSWSQDSSCDWTGAQGSDRTRHNSTAKVTGRKRVTVDGRRVQVFVIEAATTSVRTVELTGGAATVLARKDKSTYLFAPAYGLVVHSELKAHAISRLPGSNQQLEVWSDRVDDLLSLTPG